MPAIPGRAQCIVSDRTQNYVWISMRMLVVVCHYFVIFEDFGRGILLEVIHKYFGCFFQDSIPKIFF